MIEDTSLNTSCFTDFAGTIRHFPNVHSFYNPQWIIDSGASNHVSGDVKLMTNLRKVKGKSIVILPNRFVKVVQYIGDVILNSKVTLTVVLFVPGFKFNHIFVHRLVQSGDLTFTFNSSSCMVQGQRNSTPIALGKASRHLYLLSNIDDCNFGCSVIDSIDCNKPCKSGPSYYV